MIDEQRPRAFIEALRVGNEVATLLLMHDITGVNATHIDLEFISEHPDMDADDFASAMLDGAKVDEETKQEPTPQRLRMQIMSAAQESVALGQSPGDFLAMASIAHNEATKRAERAKSDEQNGEQSC